MDFSAYESVEPDEVLRCLLEVFRSPGFNPPRLPASAIQLLDITRQPDVTVSAVTALLEQDQLLAAEVLKLAQSALYNPSNQPVRTLGEAVTRLGLRRTSDLFFQVSMRMRVFRVKGYQSMMDLLRGHSVVVAHLSRHIGRLTALFDEHLFLCGLLHDAGIAAALIALSDSAPKGTQPPAFSQIWMPVAQAHAEAGKALAEVWKLPSEVALVMENHHSFVLGGYPHPSSAVVALADAAAEEAECGFFDEASLEHVDRALSALGLSRDDFPKLVKKAQELAAQLL